MSSLFPAWSITTILILFLSVAGLGSSPFCGDGVGVGGTYGTYMRTTSGLARGVEGPPDPPSSPVSPRLWVSAACERVAEDENTLKSAVDVTLVSAKLRRDPSPNNELASSKLGSNENFDPAEEKLKI